MRTTHTFALLEISKRAFTEIAKKLGDAGYHENFFKDGERPAIQMQGIAVVPAPSDQSETVLWAKSIYGAQSKKGLVEIELKGSEVTCSPTEARAFAYSILEEAESAETDEFIMDWLRTRVGVTNEAENAKVLMDFRERREAYRRA